MLTGHESHMSLYEFFIKFIGKLSDNKEDECGQESRQYKS